MLRSPRPNLFLLLLVVLGLSGCKNPDHRMQLNVWRYDNADTEVFRRAAESGDAGGQVNFGYGLHWNAESAHLFRLAADQGNAAGQTNLGVFYALGRGVMQSDAEAARLWSLAARQNFEPAQLYLAAFFLAGRGGLASDDPLALGALRATVDRAVWPRNCDNDWAVLGVARLYETGAAGLHRDLDEAIRLTERLAKRYADRGCENEEAKARLAALQLKKRSESK